MIKKPNKITLFLFLVLMIQLAFTQQTFKQTSSRNKKPKNLPTFQQFKDRFNKQYATQQEEKYRKTVYNENIKNILHSDNCQECGVNIYSDRTQDQRKGELFGIQLPDNFEQIMMENQHRVKSKLQLGNVAFPSSLDWRDRKVVTKVRNQGGCGACWAFQMIAVAQSLLVLQGNANVNTLDLSEQGLLECTQSSSCSGGYPSRAAQQIIAGNGLYNQSRFKYRPNSFYKGFICQNSAKKDYLSPATSSQNYYGATDQQIIQLLQRSPIGVTLDADSLSARYDPTVNPIHKCRVSDNQINHGVMLVGYTPTYWIIKNSWGTRWGLDGYAYISRNRANNENCVIHTWITVLESNCSIPNCDKCIKQNSCQACSAGYYLSQITGSKSYECKPCQDSNCLRCYTKKSNSALQGRCKICGKGFALQSSTQKCRTVGQININNCLVYSSDYETCQTCDDTYVLNIDGKQCLKCQVNNCQQCMNGYVNRCRTCKPGYKGDTCLPSCSDKCLSGCTTPGICPKCQSGYKGRNCQIVQCLPNCRKCSKPFTCDQCDKGYKQPNCQPTSAQQKAKQLQCNPTIQHCSKGCSKFSDICDQCDDGYYGSQCNIEYKCDSTGCRTIITSYKPTQKQHSTSKSATNQQQNQSTYQQIKNKVQQTLLNSGTAGSNEKQTGLTIGLIVVSILLTFTLVFVAFLIYRLRTIKRINIIEPLEQEGSNKSIPYVGKRVNNVSVENI